jgi:KipI family sensor histidine kinase inhibitor
VGFPRFDPAGEAAVLVTLGETIDPALNRQVHALSRSLIDSQVAGMGEAVPGYSTLLVHYDPLAWSYPALCERIAAHLDVGEQTFDDWQPRRVEIPVVYGGRFGPDLEFVAQAHGLSPAQVIERHAALEYPVYLIGFMPGFPYLGGLDPELATPRLETPRSRVPAGSVGIAGAQTGVYPLESPGGWRLIGRTPLRLVNWQSEPPFLLSPGDLVRFVPVENAEFADDPTANS